MVSLAHPPVTKPNTSHYGKYAVETDCLHPTHFCAPLTKVQEELENKMCKLM
jgi:hypothetical protein